MRSHYHTQARLLHAFANTKRLVMVDMLKQGRLSVAVIQQKTGMRQANVSQHLMALRSVGAVVGQREGRYVYYSLTQLGRQASSIVLRNI